MKCVLRDPLSGRTSIGSKGALALSVGIGFSVYMAPPAVRA